MIRKALHILVLCLFVLSTTAAYASTSCLCPKDVDTQQMEMPCHNMADAEQQDQSEGKNCCGDGCSCNDLSSIKSINHPTVTQNVSEVTFVIYALNLRRAYDLVVLDKIAPPPKPIS